MNCRLLSDNEIEVVTESAAETERLGFLLGEAARPGVTVLLRGDLGMGKTLLTQGMGKALGIGKIKSPSFVIVSEHHGRLPLAHADLYRLDAAGAVDELDLEAYADDGFLVAVEWAERWQSAPESEIIDIAFTRDDAEPQRRIIRIKAAGSLAEDMVKRILDGIGGDGGCLCSE